MKKEEEIRRIWHRKEEEIEREVAITSKSRLICSSTLSHRSTSLFTFNKRLCPGLPQTLRATFFNFSPWFFLSGMQSTLFSETSRTESQVHHQVFPRILGKHFKYKRNTVTSTFIGNGFHFGLYIFRVNPGLCQR